MSLDHGTQQYYQNTAGELAERYNAAQPEYLAQLISLLRPLDTAPEGTPDGAREGAHRDQPDDNATQPISRDSPRVLDIGCGSGRDVAALRRAGIDAYGIDPSAELIAAGIQYHQLPPDCLQPGGLPELALQQMRQYSGLLCAAVLQHIADADLLDSLYRMQQLLAPGGFLLISIPLNYPTGDNSRDQHGRIFHLRPPEQYRFFLERLGLRQINSYTAQDSLQRPGISWRVLLFTRDYTSSTHSPSLRPIESIESILWDDRKVNTYKFALLRALSHLATHRPQLVRWQSNATVALPLDAIAELWIGYYWPLVYTPNATIILQGPQANQGHTDQKADISFRSELYALAKYWQQPQRGGYNAFLVARQAQSFTPEEHSLYTDAIRKVRTAVRQPITYSGNPRTGSKLFACQGSSVYLPAAIWQELSLLGRWVEDSVIIRWADFSAGLRNQDPANTAGVILSLLLQTASDQRETSLARTIYQQYQISHDLHCVWTNTRLKQQFHVDHAIPWALWRSNDLWNLLPAHPETNNKKRARIPARDLIRQRRPIITAYWDLLYEHQPRLFLAHAQGFTGNTSARELTPQLRESLFAAFKDAMEFTATTRGSERWHPE